MTTRNPESIEIRNSYGKIDQENPFQVVNPLPLDIRYDENDCEPIYIGLNFNSYNANTASETWTVFKYTYSSNLVTRIQRRDDISWDNRGSSF